MADQAHFNRLVWHSRRGMRELDLLLVPFLENEYPTMNADDRVLYETFLKMEDQDMYNLLMGRVAAAEPGLQRILRLILDYAARQSSSG